MIKAFGDKMINAFSDKAIKAFGGKKIKVYVFLSFCLFVFLSACNNNANRSSIPIAPVQIRLNLQHYPHLSAPFATEYFTETNPGIGVWAVGFGGVLISTFMDFNSANVSFAAFDMACPYEIDRNIRVFPESNNVFAVCEECGSRFDLSLGLGQVTKGPARENLRRFNAFREGMFYLRVIPRNDL